MFCDITCDLSWTIFSVNLYILLFLNELFCLCVFSSVQLPSYVQLFVTPWIAAWQASLSITNSLNLLKLMSIESVMPSIHLILCCPLLLLPPIPTSIRVFSNESTLRMKWPKYWNFFYLNHDLILKPRKLFLLWLNVFLLLFELVYSIYTAMSSQSFPDYKNDLFSLSWAHAKFQPQIPFIVFYKLLEVSILKFLYINYRRG